MRLIHILGLVGLVVSGVLTAIILSASTSTSLQGLALPFAGSSGSEESVFSIENSGSGIGIEGLTSSSLAQAAGVYGHTTDASQRLPGLASGVWGDSQRGFGVVGTSDNIAVFGLTESGVALDAFSVSGEALLLNTRTGDFIVANALDNNNNVNRRFYVNNAGEVFADGAFNSGGADVADLFVTSEDVEAGDVLEISPDGTAVKTTTAHSTAVIGVVSTSPSLVGNSNATTGPGQMLVPVGLTGIVAVKVTSENGAILAGDLLVSSSTAGHAMRAGENPPIGSILGKALEPHDTETGTVRMLIMLR